MSSMQRFTVADTDFHRKHRALAMQKLATSTESHTQILCTGELLVDNTNSDGVSC